MLALMYYERGICACGFHVSVADDKSNFFMPQDRKCPVCAGAAQMGRAISKQDQMHAETHKSDPPMAPRPGDGRIQQMRLLTPDEVEAERVKRGR